MVKVLSVRDDEIKYGVIGNQITAISMRWFKLDITPLEDGHGIFIEEGGENINICPLSSKLFDLNDRGFSTKLHSLVIIGDEIGIRFDRGSWSEKLSAEVKNVIENHPSRDVIVGNVAHGIFQVAAVHDIVIDKLKSAIRALNTNPEGILPEHNARLRLVDLTGVGKANVLLETSDPAGIISGCGPCGGKNSTMEEHIVPSLLTENMQGFGVKEIAAVNSAVFLKKEEAQRAAEQKAQEIALAREQAKQY